MNVPQNVVSGEPDAEKPQRDFHLAEFNSLRTEVVGIVGRLDALTLWVPTVAGAILAWVLSHGFGLQANGNPCIKLPAVIVMVGAFIPLFLAIFATLASWLWYRRIQDFGAYLWRLEQRLGWKGYGWESHPKTGLIRPSERPTQEDSHRSMLAGAATYWSALLLGLFVSATTVAVIAGMATSSACPG